MSNHELESSSVHKLESFISRAHWYIATFTAFILGIVGMAVSWSASVQENITEIKVNSAKMSQKIDTLDIAPSWVIRQVEEHKIDLQALKKEHSVNAQEILLLKKDILELQKK